MDNTKRVRQAADFRPQDLANRLGHARWIWGGRDPRPVNAFRLFRRDFTLGEIPTPTEAWCFAEARHKLYVNGQFVQLGPMFCQPSRRLVDRHDITAYLRPGRNCIGFIVYCPGIMTGQWTLTNPGLFCRVCSPDNRLQLGTDATWQTTEATAWRHPTEICTYGKGFMEWHVAADLPKGWATPDFDAVGWDPAKEYSFFAHGDPQQMIENYLTCASLVRQPPVRLLACAVGDGLISQEMRSATAERYIGARTRWFRLMGAWHGSCKFPVEREPVPEPVCARADMESRLPLPEGMIKAVGEGVLPLFITVPATGHPVLVFDLGVVRSGLITLALDSESGGCIDVGGDDRAETDGRVRFARETANADRLEVPAGRTQWEGFFEKGLRYLQVVFRNFSGVIRLERAGILETLAAYPAPLPARFECDDDLLNRIWQAAVETTRLYLTNGCASGDAVRERVHWLHDDSMAMRMAFYCFGEWRTWRRGLELMAEAQGTDGCFPVISPGHFEDFNMVCGPCYWVVQVQEYAFHTGDHHFAKDMLSHARRFIDYELRFANGDGLLYETPGRRFLSWADGTPRTPYAPGETWRKATRTPWGDFFDPPTLGYNAIINAYWLWCLREAVALARMLAEEKLASHWSAIFAAARPAYEIMFRDPTTALYRDNVAFDHAGQINAPTFCESTLFVLIRAGLLPPADALRCLDRIWQPDFICCRSSGGLELSAIPPFLIDSRRMQQALALWRDRWGEPVKAGATTCGEEFFHTNGNSDCHIHGAAPARDFIESLAGIRIAGPMWSKVVFAPPADGPDLQCEVPTVEGRIRVQIGTRPDRSRFFLYSVPSGTQAIFQTHDGTMQPLSNTEGELDLETGIPTTSDRRATNCPPDAHIDSEEPYGDRR